MWKNAEIFRKAIETAKNHLARVEEGSKLLKQGRSLDEMTTPITGLSAEETLERRGEYLRYIGEMDISRLRKHLAMVKHQINNALEREEGGTSEHEWQRNAILRVLGEG